MRRRGEGQETGRKEGEEGIRREEMSRLGGKVLRKEDERRFG